MYSSDLLNHGVDDWCDMHVHQTFLMKNKYEHSVTMRDQGHTFARCHQSYCNL